MKHKKKRIVFFRLSLILTVITLLGPSIALGSLLTFQVGEKPKDVAVNITTSRAVVVNAKDDIVSIIDLSVPAVIATVAVGERPDSVAVNDQTNIAVVANEKDNTVSIIDLDNFTVTVSIDVGEDPESVAINQLTNKAFVANHKDDTISVIDLNTMTVIASIPTNRDPSSIAIYESANKGIVASEKDGNIQVFDLETNSLVSTIPVGNNPIDMAINEAMGTVLVVNEKDNSVTVINIATSTVIATIAVSKEPKKIAVNPDTGRALVTSSKEDQISVIDLSANTVIGEISTGEEPYGVSVNRINNTAIISNSDDDSISIIDLNTIPYTSTISAGEKPNGVDVNHENNIAVVANEKSDNVSIIDIESGIVLNTVDTDKNPMAVSINPEINHALVVNKKSNTLNVIDISTGTVLASVQIGKDPVAVAVNTITNRALVANKKDNNVSVIDLNTNALISYIDVGKSPYGVAIDPGINRAIVANKKDDTVSIIDLASENILFTVDVGKNPADVKINKNTHIAAVINEKDDTVSIVDMNSGTILSTVPVGDDPSGIAINSRTNQALIANHHDKNISVLDLSSYIIVDTIHTGIEVRKIAVNQTNNTAVLTGEDSDGATIIRLSGGDVVPPNMTITSHQNGQTVTSSPITISGTVDDSQAEIYTGNIQADVANSTFTIAGIELVAGANQITITANDIAGNNSTINITLLLGADLPVPDINPLPVITGECTATVPVTPTATDAAGNQVNATTNDPLTFASQGTYTITWTYDDGNGNVSTQSQTVIVNDITAPVPALSPLPIVEGEGSVTVSTTPTATDNCTGAITGTTSDSLTYSTVGDHIINWTYDDGNGNMSSQQQTVRVINSPPVASDDAYTVDEDNTLSAVTSVLANDSDINGDVLNSVLITGTSNGALTLNTDGTFTYTSNADFNGSDSFTYTANDGTVNSNTATVTITVQAINDSPVATDDAYTIEEDGILSAVTSVLTNDSDVDGDSLNAVIMSGTSNGTLTLNAGGTFTYSPNSDFNGFDSFTYVANDGLADSSTATVSITVSSVNDAPVAVSDGYSVVEDNVLNAVNSVLANDSDVDNDSLTAVLVTGTINGTLTLNVDGTLTYTPNTNYNGTDTFTYQATDGLLQSAIVTVSITIAPANDTPAANAGIDQSVFVGESVTLDGSGSSDIDGDTLTYSWAIVSAPADSTSALSSPNIINPMFVPDMTGTYTLELIVNDSHVNSLPDSLTIIAESAGGQLPPDPSDVAPPLDQTVTTTIYDQINFLYTGINPIQTGMTPDTIEPRRAAVLRGLVSDRDGNPLPGVTVKILDNSKFGQTLTRLDGIFDLAANGGGSLTVTYELEGYMPVQRTTDVPWQDFKWLPDVILIELDPQVTSIDLSAGLPMQVAQGSSVTDDDGTRQATLLFPQGNQAEMVFPDGSTQPLTTLNVRATEYTVGPNGPQAMPGELPPTSGYTYAVELSVDEAMAAGAKQVNFLQPVPFYLENFLGFPVGGIVPVGYYDRDQAAWIPSDNGLIVQVLSVVNGLAELDVEGSGLPADSQTLTDLGITDIERENLVSLYLPGESLWRVAISHFTAYDLNWSYGPPGDAEKPKEKQPELDPKPDDPCQKNGSIIECESQVLGESIGLTGVPFSLNYRSDRVIGRKTAYELKIALSGDSIPASLEHINLEITVAGRKFSETFPALTNQSYLFTWDGMNAYGKTLQGGQLAKVRIGYVYRAIYYQTVRFGTAGLGTPLTNIARPEITLWQSHDATIGEWDARFVGIGGWSLSEHHIYDYQGRTLFKGDGARLSSKNLKQNKVISIAGTGTGGFSGDNGFALNAQINGPFDIDIGPDGSQYIADIFNNRIRHVSPDGIISTVAGNGSPGFNGDGLSAILAALNNPTGVAVDSKGNIFISDSDNERIRKVGQDGIIETVVGNGTAGFSGDGGPAVDAQISFPTGIDIGPDGSLYFSDTSNNRIRRVDPGGIITTVAGNEFQGFSGDGGPATDASLDYPYGVVVGESGNVYIADSFNNRIRRVSIDGIINTIAGNGDYDYYGDGGAAIMAALANPISIEIDSNGILYISDADNNVIRRVDQIGIIHAAAGAGDWGFIDGGSLAATIGLDYPNGLAVGPDNSLFIANYYGEQILKMEPTLPGYDVYVTDETVIIPDNDANELYIFDTAGRHLRTLNAHTDTVKYQFFYDGNGYLTQIQDGDNNITIIERNLNGEPSAIISADNQRTELFLDANGYLASISNPDQETYQIVYSSDGLLEEFTDPKGNKLLIDYDPSGRLIRDENAAGGFWELSRTDLINGYEVSVSSALNRTTIYSVENLSDGSRRRIATYANGSQQTSTDYINGIQIINSVNGTQTSIQEGPDPRFGMLAPIAESMSITTPGGLAFNQTTNRTVTLADAFDLLSLVNQTDTINMNGRLYSSSFDKNSLTNTTTTPKNRQTITTVDGHGKPVNIQIPGLEPVTMTYDIRGRLTDIINGSGLNERSLHLNYSANGNVSDITDGVNRTTLLEYDLAGRVTRNILPDLREINYGYDANGNVTSITPPSRPAHFFDYTAINLTSTYHPPDIGIVPDTTVYSYDLDKAMTQILRPDGGAVNFTYNTKGQMTAITIPGGVYAYAYDPSTGKLITLTDPDGGMLNYTYDGSLLIDETWVGNVTGTVTHGYDNNFWVTSLLVNSDVISYGYDNDGLLTQAGSITLTRNSQNGLLSGTTLGNVTTSLGHNGFAEVSNESASYSGTSLYNSSFVHDNLGRIIERTETVDSVTNTYAYGYDLAGRLERVDKNGTALSTYAYDANGNRLSLTTSAGTVNGVYDAQDRLTTYGGATYTYTANGELETKTVATDITTYNYDELGNLISVTLPDGTLIDYIIDGRNRRVAKKVNSVFSEGFLYKDQLNPVAKVDDTGSMLERYVYADKGNVPAYMIKGANTYRIISDHLGSPRIVVDINSGAVLQRMDYDEFGNVILDTNLGFQPFGFAGGLYDQDTKLVRFGIRDYNPETGRWTSKDLIRFAGGDTNLYGYVLNNPVNIIDPLGLESPIDWYLPEMPHQPLPGYNYCGPGSLPNRAPSNGLDDACRSHDNCYGSAGMSSDDVDICDSGQDTGPSNKDTCDDALCSATKTNGGWIRPGVKYLFCD